MDVYTVTQWLVVGIITVLILLRCFLYWRFGYWRRRGVPYAEPQSLALGNLNFIMKDSVYDFFFNLKEKHPDDYVGIFLTWKPAIVIQSPELARKVLVKDYDSFQDRHLYSDANDKLGSLNIFTVKNPIWSDMRHHLSPMFTSYRLKLITELMNVNAQHLVEKIQRDYIENKKSVNLKDLFTMYTSDTVAFSVFGIRTSALSGEPSPLWDQVANHMLNWTYWRALDFMFVFFMPFLASLWRTKFFSQETSDHLRKMFWDTVKQREKTGATGYKDLVNHLLALRDNAKLPAGADAKFADDLMMAQVAIFVFGAVETSSTILSYALHELAHHPEEQETLHNELDAALEENGNEILQYEQLNQLAFLNACIYETTRKYPPVPHLDRICTKKYKVDDKLTLEPGTPVLINLPALHHNDQIHQNPLKWNPYRPLPSSDNDNMQFTFLPFGDGPRFCIGKRYGMMQVRAALAQIMTKYRVDPGPVPYKLSADPYSVIMYPQEGGSVKFSVRK